MISAVQIKQEENEIVSLLRFAKSGSFTEGELSQFYFRLGLHSHPDLELVIADHMAAFCRAPIKGRERKPFTREEIEREYPYMEEIRARLPHANLLDGASDEMFRAAALVGGIVVVCKLTRSSPEWVEAIMAWRTLLFAELKAVG